MWYATLLLSAIALHGQWPQFRGPNAGGVAAADAAPPVELSHLLWKQSLPLGASSPAIWGDRIFLTAFDPDAKKLEVICVARGTGAILWRHAAPATEFEKTHVVSNPATATPAVDEQSVYAYFGSYGLMAFKHSGDALWTLPLEMPKTSHGSGASPILAGDLLILNHDASTDGYLLAVDRRSGKQVWKQPYPVPQGRRAESYSTPMLWHDQIVLHRLGVIEAYDVKSGKPGWSFKVNTSGASTPVSSADTVYVQTWNLLGEPDQRGNLPDFATFLKLYDKDADGVISQQEFPKDLIYSARPELEAVPSSQNYVGFRQIDTNRDGFIQQSEWEAYVKVVAGAAQEHGMLALRPDGESAKVIWRDTSSIPEVPSPLLYQDRVFLIRNGGVVTCLDAANGKLIYRTRMSGAGGPYYSSPVAAAGRVYLTSSEGVVTVLDARADSLHVLAHNELREDILATPAIAGNQVYVRTATHLIAYGDPDVSRVKIESSKGPFVIEVHRDWAPIGAGRFLELVRAGYFDDSRFFRVIAGRFAQFGIAGDPEVSTRWRSRSIADDPVKFRNVRGTIAFAMTGPNARTTQLYINTTDQLQQDAQGFAPIGRIVEGMDVVDRLNSEYGETAGGGMRGGKQDRMFKEGNAHLDRDFPKLDRLIRASVLSNE